MAFTTQKINTKRLYRRRSRAEGPGVIITQAFAFDESVLVTAAAQAGEAWHLLLLDASVAGLWEQRPRRPVFVAYLVTEGVLRLFYTTAKASHPRRFHKFVSTLPGYMECGQDVLPDAPLRALLYWEPPCTMAALWPMGEDFDPELPRIVDTGNLLAYSSYPAAGNPDGDGAECIRVPTEESGNFIRNDREYRYVNRWFAGWEC